MVVGGISARSFVVRNLRMSMSMAMRVSVVVVVGGVLASSLFAHRLLRRVSCAVGVCVAVGMVVVVRGVRACGNVAIFVLLLRLRCGLSVFDGLDELAVLVEDAPVRRAGRLCAANERDGVGDVALHAREDPRIGVDA